MSHVPEVSRESAGIPNPTSQPHGVKEILSVGREEDWGTPGFSPVSARFRPGVTPFRPGFGRASAGRVVWVFFSVFISVFLYFCLSLFLYFFISVFLYFFLFVLALETERHGSINYVILCP